MKIDWDFVHVNKALKVIGVVMGKKEKALLNDAVGKVFPVAAALGIGMEETVSVLLQPHKPAPLPIRKVRNED